MNENRSDRDVRNRKEQLEDMTSGGAGANRERNRESSGDDKATGISNRPLDREIEEQQRVPDRGTSKEE